MVQFRLGFVLLALLCCLSVGCSGDAPPPPATDAPAQDVQAPQSDALPPKG